MSSQATVMASTPGLMRRMACWLYESMLLFGVVFTTSYFFSVLTQTRHALDNRLAQQITLFLVLALYFIWFWRKGQTLAMKTWRIKMVSTHGQAPKLMQATLRFLLSWVWVFPPLLFYQISGLGFLITSLWAVVWIFAYALTAKLHPQGQFWHDALAQTRLVDAG